jgi:exonuclease III
MQSTFNSLRVTTFNCKNVKSSVDEIRILCNTSDIVVLQETWLSDADLPFLTTIDSNFYCKGISSMCCEDKVLTGRPYGGLAILWRKSIGQCFIVQYDDPRLLGIEVRCDGNNVLFVNMYMPYDCTENEDDFVYYINKVNDIVESYVSPYVFIIGDFNANICTNNVSHFGNILKTYCTEESLVIADQRFLARDTFTFVSSAHNTCSWLDHVITTATGYNLLTCMNVIKDFVSSDHIPLCMELDFKCTKTYESAGVRSSIKVDWSSLDADAIKAYTMKTKDALAKVSLDFDLLTCSNFHCNNPSHKHAIDEMYGSVIQALASAGKMFISEKSKTNNKTVPGWNEYVKEAHCDAREAFLMWQANGKPRFGPICNLMNKTRARFKHCLRYCRSIEDKARADAIARKFLLKDNVSFWKDVKKLRNVGSDVLASTVGGVTGEKNISSMWQDHYSKLLNSNDDVTHRSYVEHAIKDLGDSCSFKKLTYHEVNDALKELKVGKSAGIDDLQSEHFKYADMSLSCLLCMIFNVMFSHGYVPQKLMQTLIIPIIKDKKGLVTDKDNYRPIAITSVVSKLVELILLERMQNELSTVCNQFGFKRKLGTDMCIFTLKQILEFYKCKNSPVYVCFLDASKAFDRINHWSLFRKLIKRGVNIVLLRLLVYWYRSQQFCIRWGSAISSFFNISNGVRQGGIMSPILFNVYMDDLSKILNDSNVGCCFNGVLCNHLMYADDTCILALSLSALYKLLFNI